MRIKYKTLIIAIVIPLVAGGVSALITSSGMKNFDNIFKPDFAPPAVVFPIVWTVLYVLMGISSYLIFTSDEAWDKKYNALKVYGVSLVFNFCWSIFFFNFGAYLFSFIWLIVLLILVVITVVLYFGIRKTAAYLQIPYIVWLIIAAYLNMGVYLLNR